MDGCVGSTAVDPGTATSIPEPPKGAAGCPVRIIEPLESPKVGDPFTFSQLREPKAQDSGSLVLPPSQMGGRPRAGQSTVSEGWQVGLRPRAQEGCRGLTVGWQGAQSSAGPGQGGRQ